MNHKKRNIIVGYLIGAIYRVFASQMIYQMDSNNCFPVGT